ncbi:MAG: 50S ribosomal protein L28 [Lachnospiraceae bacterium]|nr:50S ribosomal protein L28 [Lachnospiraceae bacterium]
MAIWDICGKGVHFGNNVSHSLRRSNRIFHANVKRVKCMVGGTPKTLHVCSRCLKSDKVERA